MSDPAAARASAGKDDEKWELVRARNGKAVFGTGMPTFLTDQPIQP
jgi:hypothetical protein